MRKGDKRNTEYKYTEFVIPRILNPVPCPKCGNTMEDIAKISFNVYYCNMCDYMVVK
jgi:ribosomal protein L37AE/L43A